MTAAIEVAPLSHPGPVAPVRLETVPTRTVVERAALPPGRRLLDAIDDELARLGVDAAQVELLGGPLARVAYCFPALCHDGSRAAWYSETHEAITPAELVGGTATVGRRDGERFMHAHAVWLDAHGSVRGGHLWPDTVVGATPVEVVLHALADASLTSGTDDETLMPVFTPAALPSAGPTATFPDRATRRAVMARVRPGVDLHEAVVRTMSAAGFTRASVRGSLGSLVGATLDRGDGALVLPGPATEVTLAGHAVVEDGVLTTADLSAHVIDRHGAVHSGRLVVGGNLVAITMELLVEEVA